MICVGVPTCCECPAWITAIRSPKRKASCISCVTKTIVGFNFWCRSKIRSCDWRLNTGSKALNDSSIKTKSGLVAKALTIATRCFWPPESSAGLRLANTLGSSSTARNNSCARARRFSLPTPSCSSWIVILSYSVKFGNKLLSCNTYPVFRRNFCLSYSLIFLSFR